MYRKSAKSCLYLMFFFTISLVGCSLNLILKKTLREALEPVSKIDKNSIQFTYCSPGNLLGNGESGFLERGVFIDTLGFPIELNPRTDSVVSNSQVYMHGGYCSSGTCGHETIIGSVCSAENFAMPWRDTFCEKAGRTYGTSLCPDGVGHQGIDVRAPTSNGEGGCKRNHRYSLAVSDGTIVYAKGAVVKLRNNNGVTYTYRHLNPGSLEDLNIRVGESVSLGERLGRIDQFNNDGSRRYTTVHLHLEASMRNSSGRTIYLPLYTSLIASYRKLNGLNSGIDDKGNLVLDSDRENGTSCNRSSISEINR